jgi:hypothetical protein
MDDFFVTALVRASTCRHHTNQTSPSWRTWPFTTAQRKVRRKVGNNVSTRAFHSGQKPYRAVAEAACDQVSREELKGLVDIYGEWDDSFATEAPLLETEAIQDGLKNEYFSQSSTVRTIEDHVVRDHVQDIMKLLDGQKTPVESIIAVYQALPTPRASYLQPRYLTQLLNLIAVVPRKTELVMLRYLSILDDMKEANIPIHLHHWNTAIHLAGRHLGRHAVPDVESSISIWKEMESLTPNRGDHVTFNILFDVAVKGEKYVLAEMIHKEAVRRGLKFDRLSHMAQIFYHGVRRDGSGVRKAYMQLVEAGEIVDSAVLTNVLTGLIKAGELPAAEETFQRMKTMHAKKAGATGSPHSWHERRELRRILTHAGERYRDDAVNRRLFQDAAPIAPDWRTYKPFVKHHSDVSGNFDRVMALLEEMDLNGIPLTGPIFFWVFAGFQKFGGIRYSSWRAARLELFWELFLKCCDEHSQDVWFDHGIATSAVWAFHNCVGRDRAQAVWVDIRNRWEPTNRSLHLVNNILRSRPGENLDQQRTFGLD